MNLNGFWKTTKTCISVQKNFLPPPPSTSINFNQRIEKGVLPSTLNHLEFGKNFNQTIGENVQLPELSYLKLDEKISEVDAFPPFLKHLEVYNNFNPSSSVIVPKSLSLVTVNRPYLSAQNDPLRFLAPSWLPKKYQWGVKSEDPDFDQVVFQKIHKKTESKRTPVIF